MSHFTVLVIGENPEAQLAPFHEYECTGEDDEFVIDLDITNKVRAAYEESTVTRYKDIYGNLYEVYGDEFYRDPTEEEKKKIGPIAGTGCGHGLSWSSRDWNDGRGYRTRIHFKPDFLEEVEIPRKEIESFLEYCIEYEGKPKITKSGLAFERGENGGKLGKEYKYGYTLVDEITGEVVSVINRTNPNSKWDWYVLGGRWTGFFKVQPVRLLGYGHVFDCFEGFTASEMEAFVKMKMESPEKFEKVISKYNGKSASLRAKIETLISQEVVLPEFNVGTPGLMTNPPEPGWADSLRKKDIDFDGMRNEAAEAAGKRYDEAMELFGHLPPCKTWKEILATDLPIEQKRELYNNQERTKACQGDERFMWDGPDPFNISREEFIQNARNQAIITHAVIKDGHWYERGEMGWWAVVHDEKSDWDQQFSDLLDSVDDDTLLSVYDCHI